MPKKRSDELAEERRSALNAWIDHLIALGKISSRNNWCDEAKASEPAVRAFLTPGPRQTNSLNEDTYRRLAEYAGVTPDDLRRQPPALQPDPEPARLDARQFILEAFNGVTEEDKHLILRFVEKVSGKRLPEGNGEV